MPNFSPPGRCVNVALEGARGRDWGVRGRARPQGSCAVGEGRRRGGGTPCGSSGRVAIAPSAIVPMHA